MRHSKKDEPGTIGIFNDSYPPIMDGVSLATKNYAYWIQKKDRKVCVVTPKYPNYTDNDPFPVYRYTSVPILGRKPYRFGLPDIDLNFKKDLEKISFEIVHAHCPFSSGRLALSIAKKQRIPLVATFHSKYRDDFEHSVNNKFIAKQMTKEIIRFFEKADEVWIPQASVEETIREYGFKGRVEVVDNGNDFAGNEDVDLLKAAARKELGLPENQTVMLFVGQHIWEKNTRLIVESLFAVRDSPFQMIFIGIGYAREDLIRLTEEMDMNDKISFKGVVTDREILKKYYAAADLFLFPSIYDNAPLVVREAGALQTPSVLVAGSNSAEIITDNFNGFLIENSVESFASKLRELMADPQRINFAGKNASRTIARSWEDVTNEVIDRYQHLIQRKWKK